MTPKSHYFTMHHSSTNAVAAADALSRRRNRQVKNTSALDNVCDCKSRESNTYALLLSVFDALLQAVTSSKHRPAKREIPTIYGARKYSAVSPNNQKPRGNRLSVRFSRFRFRRRR
jgi:hypothetical protein